MDFVIFGMGLGATLVVLGWFWRTLGPRFRHQPGSDALLSGEQMVERISWMRFCRSGGFVWIMGGCLLLFAALVSLLLHLSDRTGALVVLIAFAVVAFGVIAWVGAYLRRFGLIGLVTPRASTPAPIPRTTPRPAPGRQQPRLAAATAAPVQGPPIPASLADVAAAGSPAPESLADASGAGPEQATAEPRRQATDEPGLVRAEGVAASVADSDGPEIPPTIIGAEHRNDQLAGSRPEEAAAPEQSSPPAVDLDLAPASGSEAITRSNEADQTDQVTSPASPSTTTASGPDEDKAATGLDEAQPVTGPEAATGQAAAAPQRSGGSSGPAGERRVGSAAFQESIARQEANLARAAGDRAAVTAQTGQDPAPAGQRAGGQRAAEGQVERERRFPAPRGAEGVHWVRADRTGRIPGGFPIKGDPATRLYYPPTAEQYEQMTARYFFASPRDAENAGYRQATPPHRVASPSDRKQATSRPVTPPPAETAAPAGIEGRDWVRGDGTNTVPAGFPIKGNASSKLFHPVGSRFYDRTIAEYYFASPEQAEAAGYQLPRTVRDTSASTAGRLPAPRSVPRAPSQPHADHDSR